MGKDGFDNEKKIVNSLNGKDVLSMNSNMRKFLDYLYPELNEKEVVLCLSMGGTDKSDILISLKDKPNSLKKISIKKGYGNSVHQEPVEEFIEFLSKEFKINDKLKNDIRFFVWGDYTTNGKGNKNSRMSASEIRNKFGELIDRISNFMETHKKELITRFVIVGPKSSSEPDVIYYGDEKDGIWADSKKVLNLLCKHKAKSAIPVGGLSFQAWNRAIKENSTSEHKRGVIQLKWASIKEDLKFIMKNE